MQANYTTYDIRREYDIININKHADVMTAAMDLDPETGKAESGHPFAYARVLGIFHCDVVHLLPGKAPTSHAVEFLYVHWYCRDLTYEAGFKQRRLHRLELMPQDHPSACGFLDPNDVVRGAHIIPAFFYGASDAAGLTDKWRYFYVNL